jgi:hypothetical protein
MREQSGQGLLGSAPRPNLDQLVDTRDFAVMACISETYARQLRVLGGGPRYIKLTTKTVRYRMGDILDWISSRPAGCSTSEIEAG